MTDRKKDIADNGRVGKASNDEISFSNAPISVEMSMTALDVARSVTHADKRNHEIKSEFPKK